MAKATPEFLKAVQEIKSFGRKEKGFTHCAICNSLLKLTKKHYELASRVVCSNSNCNNSEEIKYGRNI